MTKVKLWGGAIKKGLSDMDEIGIHACFDGTNSPTQFEFDKKKLIYILAIKLLKTTNINWPMSFLVSNFVEYICSKYALYNLVCR